MGYKEAKTKRGVTVRTYATPDNVNHTKFALDTAVKVLDYYEEYFGIEYPLAKCDMIALPDFASGAMENWGCITYREVCMLDDPKNTSLSNRQLVALVVAHELAHQWFGNLVTMKWWTDLWLNEGFASWIEYLAIDHLFPEWNLWEQFLVSERERGLKLDALESTHPIEVPVHHPDEIRTIFDSISYSKGASIINMLHDYLGKDLFRSGLHAYLAKHKYANTYTVDLWTSLEIVSKKPVKDFMHTWTSKPGFPVLKVTKNENSYNLEQSRFFLKNDKNDDGLWPLPLLSEETPIDILSNKHAVLDMKTSKPAIFNHGQSGFYRVGYSSDLVENIIESLDSLQMVDKIGLLCDLTENTKNGISTSQSVLKILPKFKQVNHSSVWDVISGWIGITKMVMDDEQLREDIKKYVCDLIDPQYKRLGWEKKSSDTIDDQLLRPTILGMGISADHPEITKKALEIFKSVKQASDVDPSLIESIDDVDVRRSIEVDPDLRGVVFGAASKHGDESDFDKLLDLHNKTSNSEERDALCAAITGFRQPDLILRSLELIKSDHVRLQDVTYWIVYSFMNRHAKNMTWSWLKENWQWLRKNFEGDLGFYRIPIFAARCFSSEEFKKEYTNFFDPLRDPAFNRSIDQGLETLSWHIDWRNRDLKNIQNFLANY
jgi:puromycin-sensitive aminopeptidase